MPIIPPMWTGKRSGQMWHAGTFTLPLWGYTHVACRCFCNYAKLSLSPCNPPGLASAPHAELWFRSRSIHFVLDQILHTNQSTFVLMFVIWQREPNDSGSEANPEFTLSSLSPSCGDHDTTKTGTKTGPVCSSCLHGLSRQTSRLPPLPPPL